MRLPRCFDALKRFGIDSTISLHEINRVTQLQFLSLVIEFCSPALIVAFNNEPINFHS